MTAVSECTIEVLAKGDILGFKDSEARAVIEKVTLKVLLTDLVRPGDREDDDVAVETLDCEFDIDADVDFVDNTDTRPLGDSVVVRDPPPPSPPVGVIKEVAETDCIDDGDAVPVAEVGGDLVTEIVGELVAEEVNDMMLVLELV